MTAVAIILAGLVPFLLVALLGWFVQSRGWRT